MFSQYFIDKPRFAGVIAIVMILLGLLAIVVLPVSQYPPITPPQIVVSTVYAGASAQVLVDTDDGAKHYVLIDPATAELTIGPAYEAPET